MATTDHRSGVHWCAQRYGQSITFLQDGRIVLIGGEHEDSYDEDFCIYNDVVVHYSDGSFDILGCPETAFPPTDFHTATVIEESIYVIGSLGYPERRDYGHTPVYRVDTRTFAIEQLNVGGEAPGWIFDHRAAHAGPHEVHVWAGTILTADGSSDEHKEQNNDSFVLDLQKMRWRQA